MHPDCQLMFWSCFWWAQSNLHRHVYPFVQSIIHNPRFRASTPESEPQQQQQNVEPDSFEEDPSQITSAVFYSITSTQRGHLHILRGGWMSALMDEYLDWWVNECSGGWIYSWMNVLDDEWMNAVLDDYTDGWMYWLMSQWMQYGMSILMDECIKWWVDECSMGWIYW